MSWWEENSGKVLDVGNNLLTAGINIYRDRKAREWQEEMWNKQNEYNLPVNQRKRLEDAGINPNLAFGSSASSGLASSPPGTPSTHDVKLSLGEFYLRKKQIEAELKMKDAETKRYDEMTDQLRMQNAMFSALFQDTLATKQQDLYVQRIVQGWQEDNIRHKLDVGLETDEQKLDAIKATNLLTQARTDHTKAMKERLEEELNHLRSKWKFEEGYYNTNMNPYETSTPLGIMRYLIANIENVLSNWIDL